MPCLDVAWVIPGSFRLRRWCGASPVGLVGFPALSPPILRILSGVSTPVALPWLAVVPGAPQRLVMLGPGYRVLLGCLALPPRCCVVPVVLRCPRRYLPLPCCVLLVPGSLASVLSAQHPLCLLWPLLVLSGGGAGVASLASMLSLTSCAFLALPWVFPGLPGWLCPLPLGHVLYSPPPVLSSPAPWVCLSLPGAVLCCRWSCCLASPLPHLLGRTCGADGRLFVHCV